MFRLDHGLEMRPKLLDLWNLLLIHLDSMCGNDFEWQPGDTLMLTES
jgi:hypothetical protein